MMCKLCAGSPDIPLYEVKLSAEQAKHFNKIDSIIYTDVCIGKEIEFLINNGVTTTASCCGHGEGLPCALILKSSKNEAEKLGYICNEYDKNRYIITLKSEIKERTSNETDNLQR